jgi:DNA-binding NarL/FixJ family response regulator
VTDKRSKVVLAGIGRGPFEAIAPVLERQKLEIERVESPEVAVEMACQERVDLIIFDAEPNEMPLDEVVAKLRAEGSASAKSSLLVMAEPGTDTHARELIGNGVNRVMLLTDPEELIEEQVADLLHIAPRAAVRFTTRLYTSLDNGTEEIFGQTANLSISGMLVQTPTALEPGQQVVFEILIEDREGAVIGEAEIVRRASKDREGLDGVGLRFLGFKNHCKDILDSVIEDAFADPLGD